MPAKIAAAPVEVRVIFSRRSFKSISDSVIEKVEFPKEEFQFNVVSDPGELDEILSKKHKRGNSVRLASSYSVHWNTKGIHNPHSLPPVNQDFNITYKRKGKTCHW